MYTIPSFLLDQRIVSYIQFLVGEDHKNFSQLDEYEQENIVCRIIDVLGNDSYTLLTNSDDFDKTINLFSKFLKSSTPQDSYELASQMRTNAVNCYSFDLDMLFEKVLDERREYYRNTSMSSRRQFDNNLPF